jgi:methylated-DNA-protein-cysteine methyltransferase related protein
MKDRQATSGETPLYQRIYALIRQVPAGKVTTYGQVARRVGGCTPRLVGYALAALRSSKDESEVPWQRVINRQGKISPHGDGFGSAIQRQLLEDEGITFSVDGVVDLDTYGWVQL